MFYKAPGVVQVDVATIDTSVENTYTITYSATDIFGKVGTRTREIRVLLSKNEDNISNGTYSAYLDGVNKETGQPEVEGALTYLYFDNMYYVDGYFGPIEFTFNDDDLIVSFGTASYSSKQFKYNSETQLYEFVKDDAGAIEGDIDGAFEGAIDGAIDDAIDGAIDGAFEGAVDDPFPPHSLQIKKTGNNWTFKTEVTFDILKNLNIVVNENQVINSGTLVRNIPTKLDVIQIENSTYVLYHVSPSFKAFNAELNEAKELGYELIESSVINVNENKIGNLDLSVFQKAVENFEAINNDRLDTPFPDKGDFEGDEYEKPNISIEIPTVEGQYAFIEGTQGPSYSWNAMVVMDGLVNAYEQRLSENEFQFNIYILLEKSN